MRETDRGQLDRRRSDDRGGAGDGDQVRGDFSAAVLAGGAADPDGRPTCCSLYHRAVELIGKRWTGAILLVLMEGPLRFCEITQVVPDLSDRLLSERMKELEAEDIVERQVHDESPVRVEYSLTAKGHALLPVIDSMRAFGLRWLPAEDCAADVDADLGAERNAPAFVGVR